MADFSRMYIDNEAFDVPYVSIKRTADVLDKYARRTEDGDLKREVIGVYYNYQIQFGYIDDMALYDRLWNKLTEPKAFHDIVVPGRNMSFKAYISSVSDEYRNIAGNGVLYQNLTAKFTSKKPSRR